jgi:hypothetical protein
MNTETRWDLTVRRNDDVWERPLRIIGPNLTGVDMRAQIRLAGDTPGAPLADLALVTNGNAEGVRLASSIELDDGTWANDVRIRLNKSTRQAFPYDGEVGDAATLEWGFLLAGVTRIEGKVFVPAQVYGSDNAPLTRQLSYGGRAGVAPSFNPGATLTISADGGATLKIDGADLLGRMQLAAANFAGAAEQSKVLAGQSAGSAGLFAQAALVLSLLKSSIAAALASTAPGAYFGVVSGYQVALYQNDSGSATDTGVRFGAPEIHVETQGAKPYPQSVDSTAAIRAALDLAAQTGATVVGTPGKQYAIGGAGLGAWPAGVKIRDLSLRRSGTVSGPAIRMQAAGRYIADGLAIEEAANHSSQNASIEVDHAFAQFSLNNCSATKGYSGLWIKQCFMGTVDDSDFGYSSHPIYMGRNDVQGLGAGYGYAENVTITNTDGHHAKSGGDGLKTVSRTRNLNVNGGALYANDQDGIDLFAGCMKARFSGVKLYDNRLQAFDIKVGDSAGGVANYPEADWGERRDILIEGCFMDRNGYNGVKVFGDDTNGYYKRVVVSNCQIDLCGGHGIVMRGVDCVIDGNTVRRSGQSPATGELAGISVQYDTPFRSGLKVTNNVSVDNGRAGAAGSAGFLFTNCSFADVIGNTTGNRETTNQQISYFFNGGVSNTLDRCTHVGSVPGQVTALQANNVIFGMHCGLPVRSSVTGTLPSGSLNTPVTHGLVCRPTVDMINARYEANRQGSDTIYPTITTATQITLAAAVAPTANVPFRLTTDMRGLPNPFPFTYSMTA